MNANKFYGGKYETTYPFSFAASFIAVGVKNYSPVDLAKYNPSRVDNTSNQYTANRGTFIL